MVVGRLLCEEFSLGLIHGVVVFKMDGGIVIGLCCARGDLASILFFRCFARCNRGLFVSLYFFVDGMGSMRCMLWIMEGGSVLRGLFHSSYFLLWVVESCMTC